MVTSFLWRRMQIIVFFFIYWHATEYNSSSNKYGDFSARIRYYINKTGEGNS